MVRRHRLSGLPTDAGQMNPLRKSLVFQSPTALSRQGRLTSRNLSDGKEYDCMVGSLRMASMTSFM